MRPFKPQCWRYEYTKLKPTHEQGSSEQLNGQTQTTASLSALVALTSRPVVGFMFTYFWSLLRVINKPPVRQEVEELIGEARRELLTDPHVLRDRWSGCDD